MVQSMLTETEYGACLFLFLNKYNEFARLKYLSDYLEPAEIEFYYGIQDAESKINEMDVKFDNFVKKIDISQTSWELAWKIALISIYALQVCKHEDTEWVAQALHIPVDIVRALRSILDTEILLE